MKIGIIFKAMIALALITLLALTGCQLLGPDPAPGDNMDGDDMGDGDGDRTGGNDGGDDGGGDDDMDGGDGGNDDGSDPGVDRDDPPQTFNLVQSCVRLYGDADCRLQPESMVTVGKTIGIIDVVGATAYSITSPDTAGRYAVDEDGRVTVQTTFESASITEDAFTVEAAFGSYTVSTRVTVINDLGLATMETATLNTRGTDSDAGGLTVTELTSGEDGRCSVAAPCISGSYTGGHGGWFYTNLTDSVDFSSHANVYVVYKLEDPDDMGAIALQLKLESPGVTNLTHFIDAADLTTDNTWQTLAVPRTIYESLGGAGDTKIDTSAINGFSMWNWGTNNTLIIDEIFFRGIAPAPVTDPGTGGGDDDDDTGTGTGTEPDADRDDPPKTFNLAKACLRIYGDADCHLLPEAMITVGQTIGSINVPDATAYSITTPDTADRYTIDATGLITVQTAFASASITDEDSFTVEATIGSNTVSTMVTVINTPESATTVAATLNTRKMASAGVVTLTEVTMGEEGRCSVAAPCISGSYTGAWGGWFHEGLTDTIDFGNYENAYIIYKLDDDDGMGTTNFQLKLESLGVTNLTHIIDAANITTDNTWQTVEIPRTIYENLGGVGDTKIDVNAINGFGIWNWGEGNTLIIDEIYFR